MKQRLGEIVPVGPLVCLSGGAFSFGSRVAEGEYEGVGVQRCHFLTHSLRERSSLGAGKDKEKRKKMI